MLYLYTFNPDKSILAAESKHGSGHYYLYTNATSISSLYETT